MMERWNVEKAKGDFYEYDSFSGAFSIVFPYRILNICGMRRTGDLGEDGRVSG
jgi:hypothetical protein